MDSELLPGLVESIPLGAIADPVSSLSHILGAALFLVLGPWLVRRGRGSSGRVVTLAVFAFSSALLLGVSGAYHFVAPGSGARAVLQRLDHAAIFVLIASTFTVPHAILFRGLWRWGMIALIWTLAGIGVVLKGFFFDDVSETAGLVFYLGMGWIGVVSALRVQSLYGGYLLRPLVAGGVAYTAGALLEFIRWPVLRAGVLGPHELFHLCVLAGVAFHWEFVRRFADGQLPVVGAPVIATVPQPSRDEGAGAAPASVLGAAESDPRAP